MTVEQFQEITEYLSNLDQNVEALNVLINDFYSLASNLLVLGICILSVIAGIVLAVLLFK